jgi:hypothetical protein
MTVRIKEGKITVLDAAESIHLSERQMYRVLTRYRTQAEVWTGASTPRGTSSHRGYSKETRKVYNDYTITLHSQFIQFLRSEVPLPPPCPTLLLRQWLDGSLHIFWNEHELDFQVCASRPHPKSQPLVSPVTNHPWRKKFVGCSIAMRHKEKTLALKRKAVYSMTAVGSEKIGNRRKDSTRYARSVFPSSDTSPCHFY